MQIIPIVAPQVNWEPYIQTINSVTGRSPTRLLDDSGKSVGDLPSFVSSLGDFYARKSPHDSLRFVKHLLEHVSFSFLLKFDNDDNYLELLRIGLFKCLDNSDVNRNMCIVISGSLLRYHQFIVQYSNENVDFEIRYLANTLYVFFCNVGFTDIFFGLKKSSLQDRTFILK